MKTIEDVFADYRQGLSKLYDASEIESVTLLSVSEICNLSKAKIKAFPETELTQRRADRLSEILTQLKTGKPIQYILGKTEFYGLTFNVNPSVLIPRPETEELVAWVITSVGSGQLAVGNILDIGTGSGCIAVSLKKNLPAFSVSAMDISSEALQTAKENAELNQVNIEFIEADILSIKSETANAFLSTAKNKQSRKIEMPKSEIIISNPPYLTALDKTQMHTNVTDFEPHTALFVPEDDPLVFYTAIADFAATHLVPNGLLFFEINENYGEQAMELLEAKNFKNIQLRKDMNGRDRMIKASFSL